MTELKPCPFCGGTNLWLENNDTTSVIPQWVVTCVGCFQRSKPRTKRNEAIEMWNKGVLYANTRSTM